MQTVAERLGAYALSLKYDDIPADVVHQAKRTIIDTLGCALGGYSSETARIVRDLAALTSSSQPATIIYDGQKTSLDLAVFANDVMIRYLDFNDSYVSLGSGHPSDSIAALLSAAEVAHADGRELIVATVLAYEVFCRICDVMDNKSLGIGHFTIGGIASVVAVSRLLGLTQQQTVEAINITAASNIALNKQGVGKVSKWKACCYANANRNAMFAAQLAARGMTGPSPIFEGRNGFFKIVNRRPFELAPFGGNGKPFRIMQSSAKQFPIGNFAQSVVTAALEANVLRAKVPDIVDVRIYTSQNALNIMADAEDKWHPLTRETADHSIPYTAAVALMYGTVDKSHFDEKYFLHDKALLKLVGKIKCSSSEEANRREQEVNLCDMDVVLRSGECKTVRVEYHRGHWRNPMSDLEIEAKFRSLGAGMLPASRIDSLFDQLWQLELLPDSGALIQMTTAEPGISLVTQ